MEWYVIEDNHEGNFNKIYNKYMDLYNNKCVPCEGGTLPFDKKETDKN